MVTFFVSVYEKETDTALRITIESLKRFGKVILHFDRPDLLRPWVKELVDDVVFVDGLARGRGWAFENIDDDYVCTVDSHVYMLRFNPVEHGDYRLYDYGFDVEDRPWSVINKSVWHFGHLYWNRRFQTFVFECERKWYSHNPLVCLGGCVVRRLRDVYFKYGLGVIPWKGYGADQEQVYVSATRLFGPGRCVNELTYGHRSSTSNAHHEFWSRRWVGDYFNEWYQAHACFMKLHYPRELWRFSPYDLTRCKYVDDETAKRIQDEFRYTYWDFLRDSINVLNKEDRKIAEEELKYINLK
jgi:hypothetical protein